ncbi:MAG TPA: hypothetical protein VGH33_11380, partial [Isosphaeraceae bacterium]
LRGQLADPTWFDDEVADYWAARDRPAGGGAARELDALFEINASARLHGPASVSVLRALVLPPDRWSLCEGCRGSGREPSCLCDRCGGGGFRSLATSSDLLDRASAERPEPGRAAAKARGRTRGGARR